MLAFRDLLRADPGSRERYGEFKRKIAEDESMDIKRYLSLKEPFIAAMQRRYLQIEAAWSILQPVQRGIPSPEWERGRGEGGSASG